MEKSRLFAPTLLRWFDRNKREFPWRHHYERSDPYAILVAELMLQRTRAEQVAGVFSAFIERCTTFTSTAALSDEEIVGILKPLGLNHRIVVILRLLRLIESGEQEMPSSYDGLVNLPGVGDYTARAIMIYAHGSSDIALDVNVMRILSRVFGLPYKRGSKPTREMRSLAATIVPDKRVKEFNMALMDFGAIVCKERNPLCEQCPLRKQCNSYKERQSA